MVDNQKYNIVILNHHAGFPEISSGGRHYDLGDELTKKGHNVTVIASSYSHGSKKYYNDEDFFVKEFKDNFRFIMIKTKPAYRSNFMRFVNYVDYMLKASRIVQIKGEPNIILASSVHPLSWVAGYKLSKKYKARFIVEVRDLWPLSMYEDFKGIYKKIIFSFFESLEKKYYRLADSIITTMPYAYEYMEKKYGINKKKVNFIPHGINIEKFDKNLKQNYDVLKTELQDALDNYFCITYTGALSKSEGLITLVKAAKKLQDYKDIRIVIVGSGQEKENLIKEIKNNNLNNVLMFDKQNKSLIPLILNKSDVLFCGLIERQAFKYGISKNKFYDYMAAGKPIIFASNVRDSLIEKAKAGLTIKPDDPMKLFNTILFLYNERDSLALQYGKNGRFYVEQNHTTQKIANDFIRVFSNIT
jgi:glycosyltransferase involved in cell wall biosynthesis